jgi:hypothetical protein
MLQYGMIKRIEHYWKGLSAPRTQISAIPPQNYGDRFVDFITGITMTQEEAERRGTGETNRVGERVHVQSGSAENLSSPVDRPSVERTMRKAQIQTDKATSSEKGRSQSEEEKPDRILKTTEDNRASMTLPVVSEVGESGEMSEKRALSPPREIEEDNYIPTKSSTPGLRKVSPSTVATGTDVDEDESSPPTDAVDFADDLDDAEDADSHTEPDVVDEVRPKPPRIASDLIQPTSPLEASVFKSLGQSLEG